MDRCPVCHGEGKVCPGGPERLLPCPVVSRPKPWLEIVNPVLRSTTLAPASTVTGTPIDCPECKGKGVTV